MVKIRLARHGKRNAPIYRVVAIDERKKRSGEALEILGYWNPNKNDINLDKKKINSWIKKGAKPTAAVSSLLKGKPPKKKIKNKKAEEEVAKKEPSKAKEKKEENTHKTKGDNKEK